MKIERVLLILIIVTIVIRYTWAALKLGGEHYFLFPPIISVMGLVVYYYFVVSNPFYKICLILFLIYLAAFILNILEWKGMGFLLFLGSLGFIMFPVYFLNKSRKNPESLIFRYSLIFCILVIAQNVMYLFTPTNTLLTVAHMFAYFIIVSAAYLIFNKKVENEITLDERKIITFIIIANILSLLGVTFKESFYYSIWI